MDIEAWRRQLREAPEEAERGIAALREDPEGLEALARALGEDPDPDLRAWACRVLVEAPDERGLPRLLRALEDPSPSVRAAAAWALGARRWGNPGAVLHALRRRLEDLPWVAWVAAEAMARYGEEAVEALGEALRHPHPQVRLLAARALARIASPRGLPALAAALEDPSPLVRHFAEVGIDRALGPGWIWLGGG